MNINRLKLVTLGMLAVGAITLWANCVKADTLLYSDGPINGTLDAGGISQADPIPGRASGVVRFQILLPSEATQP
jgi:hypothetical protein